LKKPSLFLVWALVSTLAFAQLSLKALAQSGSVAAEAQSAAVRPVQILLIMPFENQSKVPGIEWIGEAFPEVVANRLSSSSLQLVTRGDRLIALDRLGFPSAAKPSRATVYQVAQELDADYVLMGDYHLEGNTLAVRARVLDVGRLHLGAPITESGPLESLINIQTALSWDVLHATGVPARINKDQYLAQFAPIRLDALESYVRGVIASTSAEKIKYLKEAVRLDPTRTLTMLQLGKTYYEARDYESAMTSLGKVAPTDLYGNEAQFYFGLSALYSGQMAKAEVAFSSLATRLPLTEVYNNLGVAAARLGDHRARTFFEKTVQNDPNEADYHFNLAVELYREGQAQGAAKELKIAMGLAPDAEARSFLDSINSGTMSRLPLERIKRNYDESSFRQLAAEIENATEARLQKTDPAGRAAYRVERGRELLDQGLVGEAEKQFREAVIIDPTNAAAHAGLAYVLQSTKDSASARNEAQASLRLAPSAEAYLVLARLDLADNNTVAAQQNIQRALALDPANAVAVALQHDIAAGVTGKARPPQP
jgi:tetratricopeptide (TPR) repeat protein